MPNLVGVWNPKLNKDEIAQQLAKQFAIVDMKGPSYARYAYTCDGFGFGLLDHSILENGKQPVTSTNGDFVMLLDGEIYNANELRKKYKDQVSCDSVCSVAQLCVELASLVGIGIVRLLQGLFCIALFSKRNKTLYIANDRYGFRPLFYLNRGGEFIFGSELKAICAIDERQKSIDAIGMLEQFCYGSHIMDRTWLSDYRRLEPATYVTIDTNAPKFKKYWRYQYEENASTLEQPSYFTVTHTLLDRAVEKCMQGGARIGIFLSGGYDSRSVVAAIRKYHLPIAAFTSGEDKSRDIQYCYVCC